MPQLQLFGRRWFVATDSLPVLALLLAVVHTLWLVPYLIGGYDLETTGLRTSCPDQAYLRAANYGLLALFALSAALEFAIAAQGLRGGPLETGKRQAVTPMLYIKVVLFAITLGWTVFGTYVVSSSSIGEDCWVDDPCVSNMAACELLIAPSPNNLTAECQYVLDRQRLYFSCLNEWLDHSSYWYYHQACGSQEDIRGAFRAFLKSNGSILVSGAVTLQDLVSYFRMNPDFLNRGEELAKLLDFMNIPYSWDALAESAPWLPCMNASCQSVLRASDKCGQFDQMAAPVPEPSNKKDMFAAMIYCSWGALALQTVVVVLAFNAFPDYGSVESWEGTVNGWADCLCCGHTLKAADAQLTEQEAIQVPSKEIAKSMHLLFGGIDLDPTDRLLAMFLVSKEQHRRRRQQALRILHEAGMVGAARKPGIIHGVATSVAAGLRPVLRPLLNRGGGKMAVGAVTPFAEEVVRSLEGVPEAEDAASLDAECAAAYQAAMDAAGAAAVATGFTLGSLEPQLDAHGEAAARPACPPRNGAMQQPRVVLSRKLGAADADAAALVAATAADQGEGSSHLAPPSLTLPPSPFDVSREPSSQAAVGQSLGASAPEQPGQGRYLGASLESGPLQLGAVDMAAAAAAAAAGGEAGEQPWYRRSMLMLRTLRSMRISSMSGWPLWRLSSSLARAHPSAAATAVPGSAVGGPANAGLPHDSQLPAAWPRAQPRPAPQQPAAQLGAAWDGSRGPEGAAAGAAAAAAAAGAADGGSGGQGQVGIKVAYQYSPLLSPVPLPHTHLKVTPRQAADIYSGPHRAVPRGVLGEAEQMSRLALASYGLQSVLWGKGKRPVACMGNINMLLKWLGKPLRLENVLRRRNFNAIIAIAGVEPQDLLHVSYANAPGSVLPYFIMLHRPTKSVVISVRGTVSMEDLVTDLLSTPIDVTSWMPAWAREASSPGERMYAHSGIVSATTAVLRDMEKHGLLNELLASQMSRAASLAPRGLGDQQGAGGEEGVPAATGAESTSHNAGAGAAASQHIPSMAQRAFQDFTRGSWDSQGDEIVHLPLSRAQSAIRERLGFRGWKIVVTGHSLGAAVACLLSFHLREMFPDLTCWAFSPPGGLGSWSLSRAAQPFCTSVVVGKDLISRLSLGTARRLVDDMVTSLARCKRPKLLILLYDLLVKRRRDLSPDTFCAFAQMSDDAVRALERYHRSTFLHQAQAQLVEMFPPGRLLFLRPFRSRRPRQDLWDAVWVDARALMAEGILVSPSMLHHHRSFMLGDALRSALANEAAALGEHAEPEVPQGAGGGGGGGGVVAVQQSGGGAV